MEDSRRSTVLIYGHYDVQPVDPEREWRSPPFEPEIRGEYLYARGASDDKGQLFAHVAATKTIIYRSGTLPVNVKFLIEGEEEIGSPNLPSFLDKHRERLVADVAVVSDSVMLGRDRPAITYALRGSLGVELEVRGQRSDLHSGNFGGALHNPLQGLCEILAKLHDSAGRIQIPGFYDRVLNVSGRERQYMARNGPTDSYLLASAGAQLGWGEPGYTLYERTTIRPALAVNGITGGYQGPGTKGVIPAHASAKLNFRLVPAQDPGEVDRLLRDYVAQLTPPTLHTRIVSQKQTRPVVVSRRHPAVQAAAIAYQRAFGRAPVFLRSGGTIPVVDLLQGFLGIPTVLMGFALPDSGLHAPNERIHLPTFLKSIASSIHFIEEIGRLSCAGLCRESSAEMSASKVQKGTLGARV